MHPNTIDERITEIRPSWQAWCYLHHLLSADVLRETIIVTVDAITEGKFSFSELFDEEISSEEGALSSWLLRPKVVHSDLAYHVQLQTRAIGWTNDTSIEPNGDASTKGTVALNALLGLSQADFSTQLEEISYVESLTDQEEFHAICNILSFCITSRKSDEFNNFETLKKIDNLSHPLNIILTKHIGDLYADQDEWDVALFFYKTSYERSNGEEGHWRGLLKSLRQLLHHSISTATWMIEGSGAAYQYLDKFYDDENLDESPLLICNSSHDLLLAHNRTPGETWKSDLRASFVPPPLLLNSHDVEAALISSITGDFENAFKKYWATLRRQIALGSFSDRQNTQKLFAHSLLTASNSGKYAQPGVFSLGVELLLSSSGDSVVEKIEWNERAINQYVNKDFIIGLIAQQRKHSGVSIARGRTLVSLVGQWIELFDTNHVEEAAVLMRYIIQLADENKSNFYAWMDLFTPSVKMLIQVKTRRPEFARIIAEDIADFVLKKIAENYGGWTELAIILELSKNYLEYINVADQNKIILFTADLVSKSNANLMWPLLDAALSLLYSEASYSLCEVNKEAGAAIVAAVMQSGMVSERDQAQFIANFNKFPISLVNSDPRRAELNKLIESVRKGLNVRSSSATSKIHAFLLVPELVGQGNFLEAVCALKDVLKSTLISENKLLIVELFAPIRALAHQIQKNNVMEVIGGEDIYIDIFDAIIEIWKLSISAPKIFSSLSIPRKNSAEQVIVHNWAVATFELGKSLGKIDIVESSLDAARVEEQLALGIDQARGTTAQFYGYESLDLDVIRKSGKDSFYSTLGRYIAIISQSKDKEVFLKLLVEKILEMGPREADATVLLLAIQLGNAEMKYNPKLPDYKHRVNLSVEFRSLLGPLLLELEK